MVNQCLLKQWLKNQLNLGKKVLFFSLEMSKRTLKTRNMACISEVPINDLIKDKVDKEHIKKVKKAMKSYKKAMKAKRGWLKIVDSRNIDINQIFSITLKLKPDIVYVDYLGILRFDNEDNNKKHEIMQNTARLIKQFALKHNIPFVVPMQQDKISGEFRESTAVEWQADIAFSFNTLKQKDNIYRNKSEPKTKVFVGDKTEFDEQG